MLTTELTHACVTSSITALYFGLLIWVHVTTIYFLWISKSNLNIELNSLSKYLFEKKVMWICEHSLFKKIVETCVNGFFKPYVSVQFEIHVIPRVKCYIQINREESRVEWKSVLLCLNWIHHLFHLTLVRYFLIFSLNVFSGSAYDIFLMVKIR